MNFLIIQGGRKALGPLGSGGAQPGSALRARPHHPLPGPLRTALRGRAHATASSGLCGWRRSDCPRLWNRSPFFINAQREIARSFQSVRCPWNLAGASKGHAALAITLLSAAVPHAAASQASALQTSRRRARSAEEAALGRIGASADRGGEGAPSTIPESRRRCHTGGPSEYKTFPFTSGIIAALSERAQQMRPPSNAAFTTADPRADGQADSVCGGLAGRRVCAPALPGVFGGTRGYASEWTLGKQGCECASKCASTKCTCASPRAHAW